MARSRPTSESLEEQLSAASEMRLCYCNACQGDKHHDAVGTHSRERIEGEGPHPRIIKETWSIVQCGGCKGFTVIRRQESTDFKHAQICYYPPRERRRPPLWLLKLRTQQQALLGEIYTALHTDCLSLATMGTRALLDDMFLDLVGDIGGFERKLATVYDRGLITDDQRKTIEVALEAGHAASHRAFTPSMQQLSFVLDIVEHVLNDRYIMPETSKSLAGDIPQRQKGDRTDGP